MSQELSRLVSGLTLRGRRFQGKEGASKGREEGSFLGKGGRKLHREGRKEGFREGHKLKLKRGRSEEPCPVGACLAAKS